ncbi:MAG: thioredoxin family protein [Desulfobacter sp.]|nr:thioredoxin family protein [Desulfobacter sp.]WDP85265.1 MAG: thioredoxin family protein [Desulfobacter sp.]
MDKVEFENHLKGKIVLADFSASWCGPCVAMAPVIKEVARSYDGRARVMEIDIDQEKQLATDYMVHSIPTLILFESGKEKQRLIGLQSISAIEKVLDAVLGT